MLKTWILAFALLATVSTPPPNMLRAQTATPAPPGNRIAGQLVKADGPRLTVKDAHGLETTVSVGDGAKVLQIQPGQTSLNGATPMQLTDLQPGDRLLLLRLSPATDGNGMVAGVVVAMKQADIAQEHAKEQAAWQHGVGGLVKSVDLGNHSIVIASGETGARTVTVKLGPTAVVKRYAPESVEFAQAKPSSLSQIAVGDQLRARGTHGPDPSTFDADEVVAGSFRNIAGKVTAVDPAAGLVTVADLATRQALQIKVTDDSQLRKLDDATADKLAAAMKSGADAGGHTAGGSPSGGPPSGAAENWSGHRPTGAAADMQQILSQAAAIKLADLKRGEVVMVVASSSADGGQFGAVTLLAGVDPLLRASPSASAAALSSWSLAGGAGGEGAQ